MTKKLLAWLRGYHTGVVESIDLTFGGAGNQVMRIDGVNYATWIDYRQWPKIGETVRHCPYVDRMMGREMLATRIVQ
jgi:hypothetical protein